MPKGITLEQFKTALHAHQVKNAGAQPLPQDLPKFIEKSVELASTRSERLRRLRHNRLFG